MSSALSAILLSFLAMATSLLSISLNGKRECGAWRQLFFARSYGGVN
jgi:hypothetical protein